MRNPFHRTTRRREEHPLRGLLSRDPGPARPQRGAWLRWLGWAGLPLRAWRWTAPLVVLAALYALLFWSPVFAVTSVTVDGPSAAKIEQVRAAARIEGANLFRLDEGALAQEIERQTQVRVTAILRRVPGAVTIIAAERQPRATWQVGSAHFFVDVEGVVLGPAPGPDPRLVHIRQTDTPRQPLAAGDRVAADAIYLAEQLTARTARAVGANPTSFEWQQDGGLLMRTDRGWNVRLGTSDDLDYKLIVWRAILDRAGIERFNATHTDVRFPTRPFVRSRT